MGSALIPARVGCFDCGAEGPGASEPDIAIACWNDRVPTPIEKAAIGLNEFMKQNPIYPQEGSADWHEALAKIRRAFSAETNHLPNEQTTK